MYCKKCDIKLDENVTICPTCGNTVKLKRNLKIVSLIIFAFAIITIIGIILKNNIQEKKVREQLNNQYVDITTITKNDYITFNGYTFKLPKDLQYSNSDNYIYAATSDLKVSFKMNIVNANYDSIKENYKSFIEAIINGGTRVISYYVATFETKEYFLIATIQNNHEYLYALTKLDEESIVQTLVDSENNEGYETAITYINSIMTDYEKVNAKINNQKEGSLNDFLISDTSTNISIGDLFKVQTEE